MDSSPCLGHRETNFPIAKTISPRRTPSSSSLSSSSSYLSNDFAFSPATPLRVSGVPFSWEHLPGIPKSKPSHKKQESTSQVLPLPPIVIKPTSGRLNSVDSSGHKKIPDKGSGKDPFFAALVECSKDDDDDDQVQDSISNIWSFPKVSRSISDRFGLVNLYTSCKRTCSVSESIVYIPRSSRTSYDLIDRQPRRTCNP